MLAATEIADRAGEVILDVYATDFDVRHKDDASPVTEADERAEALILPALRTLLPGIPAIGEEAVSQGMEETVIGRTFWLVDPIDGTREFLRRSGEFTVNIALIEDGEPVMGVVTAPAIGLQPGSSTLPSTISSPSGARFWRRGAPARKKGPSILGSVRAELEAPSAQVRRSCASAARPGAKMPSARAPSPTCRPWERSCRRSIVFSFRRENAARGRPAHTF